MGESLKGKKCTELGENRSTQEPGRRGKRGNKKRRRGEGEERRRERGEERGELEV
jgi:hypothetical protein